MINWMYYPQNMPIDENSKSIIEVFERKVEEIDSDNNHLESNEVLHIVAPELEDLDFKVERSKKKEDKISVPVLFGRNGNRDLTFDADAYNPDVHYVIEVEAGRAVVNYQFLKDFFQACSMVDVSYLCIAVRNTYARRKDFEKVCAFFDALYLSNRIQTPLKGLLIIGY